MRRISDCRKAATPAASAILALATCGRAQTLPGTLSYSWIGNSFMDHTSKAWVPDEVRDLCVASDGTVFTAGYSEAGGSGLAIKDGAFFGRYSGFNSGFGDPVKAVATDGTNVYWGGGNGVQRYGFASSTAPITCYPCQGLDSAGNPIYSAATSKTWNNPPEFSCIRKVVYDTTNNT